MVTENKFKILPPALLTNRFISLFSVDVLVRASGFILLPFYLRLMTQEEYGLYGYLVAIITTISLVCNLGIYIAQSKLYHDYPENQRGSLIFTLNILLVVFLAAIAVTIFLTGFDYQIVAFLFKGDFAYGAYRMPVQLGVAVAVYSLLISNYFLTSEDIRKVKIYNLIRTVMINGVVLTALWIGEESDHALVRIQYTNVIEVVILTAFSVFYIRKMKPHFNSDIAKRALGIGLPVMISALIGVFANLSDRYFIDQYGSLKDLSVYNLAMAFASIIPFIFVSFQNVWLPYFLKEKNIDVNRAMTKQMVIRLTIGFVGLSLLIIIGLKGMLLTGIIDNRYDSILPLLPIVLATAILTSLASMYSNHLIYLDKLYVIILVGVPAALLGVAVNLWLVPRFGVYGAATAALIVNLIFFISYSLITRMFYSKNTPLT